MATNDKNYTPQEAKQLVNDFGSSITDNDNELYKTTIDSSNTISSWVVIPSTKPKIDFNQVTKAIDVDITELKPNLPQATNQFITVEQYNLLLSQSLQLNNTITLLTNQTQALSSQISNLETETEIAINEKLTIQQTNTILVNQLNSLSQTIDGFAQQISTALQKSIEESIFRTSLQAQNEGYEAQIQALITQADSLNAIITGLYAQLGAAIVQLDVENKAQTLSAELQGFNINEVIFVKEKLGTWTVNNIIQDFYGIINNDNPYSANKWKVGGNLRITNVNKVPVNVIIQVYYPRASGDFGNEIKFFKFNPLTFTVGPEEKKTITAWFDLNDVELQKKLKGPANPGSKSKYYTGGTIKITVVNPSTGVTENKFLKLALGILHEKTYKQL